MLFAINAGPHVIAVSSYDRYPPEVQALPRVGALLDPDTERIISLKPDLVITYASQIDLQEQLQQTGTSILEYRHGGLRDILSTIRRLGAITQHSAEAERVAGGIERRMAMLRERVVGRPRRRTLLVFGRESLSLRNLYASGGRGFLHDVLEAAGGRNILEDLQRESVPVSLELLLARAPDAIVELSVGPAPPPDRLRRERDTWLRLSSLPAVKAGRVHLLYGHYLVVPGPRIAQAAEEIARVLHPEAFR
jgi:iron complex transport system substrate-binding protein